MKVFVFEELKRKQLIQKEALDAIIFEEENKNISLFTDIKLLMYSGILLLTTGAGILIYKNIDSISHLVLIVVLSLLTLGCFAYCYSKAPTFTKNKLLQVNVLRDYILLLACLLLLILIGYVQFQYHVFGDRWGLATFIPMAILLLSAYYFDHMGVLSMGIVNLAAWAGIAITPKELFINNDFSNTHLIYTSILLGFFLLTAAYFTVTIKIKPHFAFTYKNFGIHILFVGAIAGVIHFSNYEWLWLLFITAISIWQFINAVKEKSFYFLVVVYLYFYAAVSYIIVKWLFTQYKQDYTLYLLFLYFIITSIASIILLMRFNKILKQHEHLQ